MRVMILDYNGIYAYESHLQLKWKKGSKNVAQLSFQLKVQEIRIKSHVIIQHFRYI